MSGRHAVVVAAAGGQWLLLDLRSTNGTRVNGQPVKQALLRDGDRIEFGSVLLVFRGRRAPAPAAASVPAGLGELLDRTLAGPFEPLEDGLSWGTMDPAAALARLARAQLEILAELDPALLPGVAARVTATALSADRVTVALSPDGWRRTTPAWLRYWGRPWGLRWHAGVEVTGLTSIRGGPTWRYAFRR